MYVINIQNDVIGLVLHEICKSKQLTDFIAWPSRCHDNMYYAYLSMCISIQSSFYFFIQICTIEVDPPLGGTDIKGKYQTSL